MKPTPRDKGLVIAPVRLLQLVAPRMREQGAGQIITISSQAATKAIPFIGGYAATKSALRTLSLTAREELAADGITVSVVAPAIVDTDFGQNTPSPEPETLRRAHDGTLLSHVVTPQAVADAVADVIRSGKPKSACCPADNPALPSAKASTAFMNHDGQLRLARRRRVTSHAVLGPRVRLIAREADR